MDGKIGFDEAVNFVNENKEIAVDEVKVFWKLLVSSDVKWYTKAVMLVGTTSAAVYLWNHTELIPDKEKFGKLDNFAAAAIAITGGIMMFDELCTPKAVTKAREEVAREREERTSGVKTEVKQEKAKSEAVVDDKLDFKEKM